MLLIRESELILPMKMRNFRTVKYSHASQNGAPHARVREVPLFAGSARFAQKKVPALTYASELASIAGACMCRCAIQLIIVLHTRFPPCMITTRSDAGTNRKLTPINGTQYAMPGTTVSQYRVRSSCTISSRVCPVMQPIAT